MDGRRARFPFVAGTDPTSADVVEGLRPEREPSTTRRRADAWPNDTDCETGFDGVCAARLAAGL